MLEFTTGGTPSPVSPRLMKTPRRATLAPLGERGRGVSGSVQYAIVKYYAGQHTRASFPSL